MSSNGMIAVVSDFGADSFYAGVLRSSAAYAAPGCRIVDITHSIPPHAVDQGSFILDTVSCFTPPGTVFLAVVDPGVGGDRRDLVVEVGGRFFVGPDNGLFGEVVQSAADYRSYEIDEKKLARFQVRPPTGRTFLGRDVFAPAAGALASGLGPAGIGAKTNRPPVGLTVPPVVVGRGRVSGAGRYVDRFGNILTAITKAHLSEAFGDVPVSQIHATVGGRDAGALCRYFSERPQGSLIGVVNAWDRVEVSVVEGSAIDRFPGRSPAELSVELSIPGG